MIRQLLRLLIVLACVYLLWSEAWALAERVPLAASWYVGAALLLGLGLLLGWFKRMKGEV